MNPTQTFKLDPAGFAEIRKQIIIRVILLMLLVIPVAIYIAFFANPQESDTESEGVLFYTLLFTLPIFLLVTVFSIRTAIKRQKDVWDTYELSIDGDKISRTQSSLDPIIIKKNEITQIVKTKRGDIAIKTDDPYKLIAIPAAVLGRNDLIQSLSGFEEIENQTGKANLHVPLFSVGTLVLFASVFISNHKVIVGICGTLLTAFLIWSFVSIQKSNHVDNKTKMGSYFLFFVLFSMIGRMAIVFGLISL